MTVKRKDLQPIAPLPWRIRDDDVCNALTIEDEDETTVATISAEDDHLTDDERTIAQAIVEAVNARFGREE